jgi:hypothetical protein
MQDADLFLELAGIAGVFVGFGALIAARSDGPTDPQEVAPMRMVVAMGMMAIVAGLAPVALDRYDLTEHEVWASSSALVLASWLALLIVNIRTPEYRQGWKAEISAQGARGVDLAGWIEWAVFAIYMATSLLIPTAIVLGLVPELEAGLYFTAAVLILLGAGWALLGLVYAQRHPEAV